MEEKLKYNREGAQVYPGSFEPLPWKERQFQHLQRKNRKGIMKPTLNISEQEYFYKVEMPAPGFKREDFFIYTSGTNVTIGAANTSQAMSLPANTDTNFATAEYMNGILSLYFFKTLLPSQNQPGRIIVY